MSSLTRLAFCASAAAVLLFATATPAPADPTTPHLDPLIAELEARSVALEGSTEKAQLKQKKVIDKLLKFFAKDSKGPDKDLKAAGKAAKSLTKSFPEEFPGPGSAQAAGVAISTLSDLILQALQLYAGDVDALLAEAQALVDTAPPGKCQDKAQSALDKVQTFVDELGAPDPADLPGYAKGLAKAIKGALKGESLAIKAQGCIPKANTPNLKWWESIATVNGVDYYDDALNENDDEVLGTNFGANLFIAILSDDGLNLAFNMPAGSGVHENVFVQSYLAPGSINPVNLIGTVTVVKFPNSFPDHMHATFSFDGQATSVSGSFSVYLYDTF